MSRKALLIDYEYCCGCHSCEVACQKEHGFAPGVWGIKVTQVGPHKYEELGGTVIFDYVPVPTDLCDLCAERVGAGKLPTCVKHCQTGCMAYGTLEELLPLMEKKNHQTVFIR